MVDVSKGETYRAILDSSVSLIFGSDVPKFRLFGVRQTPVVLFFCHAGRGTRGDLTQSHSGACSEAGESEREPERSQQEGRGQRGHFNF